MRKAQINIGKLVMIFVVLIVGVILVDAIGDQIYPIRNTNSVSNESLDISSVVIGGEGNSINQNSSVSLAHNNWSISEIRAFNGTVFTSGTDYITNQTLSLIYFRNTTTLVYNVNISNTTYVDYSWKADEYIEDSSTRVIIGLIVLFFVVGLLLFIVRPSVEDIMKGFGK